MKIDGVFEGGGVKGIGFVGAICKLEELGYEWERVAGTSAGSIIAALLAAGYSGEELKEIMLECNYRNFLDKTKLQSVALLGKGLGLLLEKGLYSGDNIEKWIANLLDVKGITKFKDVFINGKSKLKIIAADVTRKNILIFPDDLLKYDIDPMEFEIAKAVRMSVGIPFYFKPYELSCKSGTSLVVDGGVLSNFPIWIFDVEGVPKWPTFGFKLGNTKISKTRDADKTNIFSYAFDIIDTIMDKNEEIYLRDKDSVRTITISTMGVGTTEFNIDKDKSLKLYKSGYDSACSFINNWNFKEYINNYRIK